MRGKLLPILLSIAAFLGGAVAAELLAKDNAPPDMAIAAVPPDAIAPGRAAEAPGPPAAAATGGAVRNAPVPPAATGSRGAARTAWFRFPQQFFVPILHGGHLDSTVILTLSVEMPEASAETVYAHEIRLRDALLRRLLIHANTGGFDGNFTTEAHLQTLRTTLTGTAQEVIPDITAVLIGDIARQDR